MAYIGKEEYTPIWLTESLPEEILAETPIELFHGAAASQEAPETEDPNFGFIIQDWFGPFLLSPPSWFMRGEC
jgi:hypothetical protein